MISASFSFTAGDIFIVPLRTRVAHNACIFTRKIHKSKTRLRLRITFTKQSYFGQWDAWNIRLLLIVLGGKIESALVAVADHANGNRPSYVNIVLTRAEFTHMCAWCLSVKNSPEQYSISTHFDTLFCKTLWNFQVKPHSFYLCKIYILPRLSNIDIPNFSLIITINDTSNTLTHVWFMNLFFLKPISQNL